MCLHNLYAAAPQRRRQLILVSVQAALFKCADATTLSSSCCKQQITFTDNLFQISGDYNRQYALWYCPAALLVHHWQLNQLKSSSVAAV